MRKTVNISNDLEPKLKAQANAWDITQSQLINVIIRKYFEEKEKEHKDNE